MSSLGGGLSTEGEVVIEPGKTAEIELKDVYEKTEETPGDKPGTGGGGSKKPSSSSTSTKKKGSSRTGDDSDAMMWFLIGLGAAGSLIYVTKKRRNAN